VRAASGEEVVATSFQPAVRALKRMGQYPPKLVRVVDTTFGSLLTLTDGRSVPINIGVERLRQAILAIGRPPLAESLASQSLGVYADVWETSPADWQRICAAVQSSPVAATAFGQVPFIWQTFGQPAAVVRDLAHRVYGGIDDDVFTSHPFHFRAECDRPKPWVYGLLSASGGRMFKTWVHPRSGAVEVQSGVIIGHYLE
jgi:hypothetical protein